ncbi:unnamed protein product [Symbiodinium sp. CCMP2592]|nr:unnamed protein product [Symbiodinium sp. CCMP2592]
MYRGHRIAGGCASPLRPIRPPRDQSTSAHRRPPRLHFMSWNASGLSSERYQQVALWLRTHGQHLAITDRVSGILVLVNLRFFQRDQIQLTSVIEGRLVHLFPSRNSVLVLGDMNIDLFPDPPHVGTQIDFALTRQTTADGIARRTCPAQAQLSLARAQPDDVSDCLLQAWTLTAPCPTTITPTHSPKTQLILHLWHLRRERRCFVQRQDPSASRAWSREAELKEAAKSLKLLCAQNRQLRIQQILQEAEQAAHKGLTAVYQVVKRLAPKTTPKPILFRDPQGTPLTTAQEAQTLKDYFCRLYRSSLPEPHPPGHSFTPFDVEELTGVIAQLPSGKAKPSWLAPAPLWSLAAAHVADVIHPALTQWLTHMTDPMPGQWPKSSLCLLAKPSKPPKCPENLRPIALLHPVSKCLAKLAAGLLRPTVQHLATRFPQFAYIGGRSVEDSIERACSHCAAVRTTLEAQKYNIHLRRQGHVTGKCKGGITLSLDLSRAFDCLPREILHKALVFAALHSGVRQGCSLSPALWSIFICYVLHLLSAKIPLSCLTAFSDDILAQWEVHEPEDILRILQDIAFIIDTLTSLGMSVSDSKTVILDGLRGPAKSRLLRPLLQHHKDKGPCLRVMCATGPLDLPFRKQHPYLGIVLSYDCFEKLSLQIRIKQSWANFSRLFSLLRSKHILPIQRLQLWTACVFSTLRYGLTSTGLPPRGPDLIRQVVAKQVRLVLKSPSWITHETTADLYTRLRFQDPIVQLSNQLQSRQTRPSLSVEAFDTPERLRWRAALPASFVSDTSAHLSPTTQPVQGTSRCSLMDVSGIVTRTYACPHCPQTFPTLIALRTHCTKSHGPSSDQVVAPPAEPDVPHGSTKTMPPPGNAAATLIPSTSEGVSHLRPPSQQQLRARFMHFAKDGMPHCTLCNRKFAAWPPFLNHHYTNSCPAQVHDESLIKNPAAPAASSSVSAADPASSVDHSELPAAPPTQADASSPTVTPSDALPLLQRPAIRDLALQDDWQLLARQLRSMHTGQGLKHCPVCHQWFTRTQDIFRHLKRQHPLPAILESLRADWLTARTAAARSPCSWCRLTVSFKTQHVAACPVLQQTITLRLLALGSGLSLQEAQRQEVQAELQLLQCWGEGAMELDVANKRREMEDAEDQEKERDTKWARPESKGKGNQLGQSKNQGPRRQPIRRSTEADTRAPEGMMWLLGKLLLRHEDQMGIDRTQNGFVMFFKRESKSQHWHALKEQKQEKMDEIAMPLRSFLMHTMLETLVTRIKDTVKSEEQLKTATTLQVFLPKEGDLELRIPFLSYNPETKALVLLPEVEVRRQGEGSWHRITLHPLASLQFLLAEVEKCAQVRCRSARVWPEGPFLGNCRSIGSQLPQGTRWLLVDGLELGEHHDPVLLVPPSPVSQPLTAPTPSPDEVPHPCAASPALRTPPQPSTPVGPPVSFHPRNRGPARESRFASAPAFPWRPPRSRAPPLWFCLREQAVHPSRCRFPYPATLSPEPASASSVLQAPLATLAEGPELSPTPANPSGPSEDEATEPPSPPPHRQVRGSAAPKSPPHVQVISDNFLRCFACSVACANQQLMEGHIMTSRHVRLTTQYIARRRREMEDELAEEASQALDRLSRS